MRSPWLMAALLALPLAGRPALAQSCATAVPAADLVEAGKLQMAINPTLPPQQFVDAQGELQGLNVDLMREVAKRMCLPIEFIRMDFPPMFPALAAARFDGIDTGMFWTEERSKIAYTVPYAQQAISITVAAGVRVEAGGSGIAGRAVGGGGGQLLPGALAARRRQGDPGAKGAKPIDIHSFTTATDVIAALRAGQVESRDPDRPDGERDRPPRRDRNHRDRVGGCCHHTRVPQSWTWRQRSQRR